MSESVAEQNARRAYWSAQLDQAAAFIQQVQTLPVQECGEPLVSLVDAADAAGVEVVFAERPHVRGLPRLYLLREGLIASFVAAARDFNQRGWIMRVEDGFRTREMQKYLALEPYTFDVVLSRVRWELHGATPTPELVFHRLSALVAPSPRVGTHMSGSAIDIGVLDRTSGHEIERGGPYLEMSELTPMQSPFVAPAAREHRAQISALMERHGFVAYPWEFWHYNSGDVYAALLLGTGSPARYGAVDLDAATGAVTPIDEPGAPLNSRADIELAIARALERAGAV